MRLVHYYPRALVGDGGPTRAMWEWAGAAHAAGCDVAVWYDGRLEAPSPLRHPAIPVAPLPHVGVARFRVPRRLFHALESDDVLVLHSTYVPGNVAAAWTARRRGIPYLVVPHGGYDARSRGRRQGRKRVWLPIERRYLENALAVHVFFEAEIDDAVRVAPKARWIVAPTGFNLPAATWDGGTGGYLAWLGRYDIRHKGLDLLVQALSRLPMHTRPALRLHGRPSENTVEDVQALADASGVGDALSASGPVSGCAKVRFLQQAAAYVHPSRWESHSLALLEALAHGIPSVVSASCSIAPGLRRADAAIVVDPTPEGIADGISTLLRNPRPYSERARHFVQGSLSWPSVIENYCGQLRDVRCGEPVESTRPLMPSRFIS